MASTAVPARFPSEVESASTNEKIMQLASDLDRILSQSTGKRIVSFGQDRLDMDIQGCAAVFQRIISKRYGATTSCLYSRRIRFLQNRQLAAFLSKHLGNDFLHRVEVTCNVAELVASSPAILVFDTANFGMMSDFDRYVLENQQFKEGKKPIVIVDHHKDNNNGKVLWESPLAYDQRFVRDYRFEAGAATSVMLVLSERAGIRLNQENAADEAAAVAAYLGIKKDTENFNQEYLTDIDRQAISSLESILTDESRSTIADLERPQPMHHWKPLCDAVFQKTARLNSDIAIVGLGVVGDSALIPYIASELIAQGKFKTSIVYAIAYEKLNGNLAYMSLVASGRTHSNDLINLPELFGEVFYVEGNRGRISKGGGRVSADGLCAMAGAEIPLYELIYTPLPFVASVIWPKYAEMFSRRFLDKLPQNAELEGRKIIIL
ncbi:hypothetical protein HY772_01320 [Candidatus Woesearchaeota archaeon]|nr:hypothetical protein [Candidatus Woesearchaeota archaeon]